MTKPIVYGARYSVYVQAVQLTLWAKRVHYELVEVDVWSEGKDPEHLARHPFGRIPALEHGSVHLYETAPVCRYIDETFDGHTLQPPSPQLRAKMGQAISIMDNYAYQALVWGVYFQRIEAGRRGLLPDEARLQAGLRNAVICLSALDALAPGSSWLAANSLTLADLHAVPMMHLFMQTQDAEALMAPHPRLRQWFANVTAFVAPAEIGSPTLIR